MFVVDTDTLTLLQHGHARLMERIRLADRTIATTIVSRMEVLRGRFAAVLTAESGERLLLAQRWLAESERHFESVVVLPFEDAAAAEFDRLRENKKLKKIGRADLLIACIVLAHGATLVSRN